MSSEDGFEERMRKLPPKLAEEQRAARAKAQAEQAQLHESSLNHFQLTDFVQGRYHSFQGTMDPNSMVTIREWQNRRGATIYLPYSHTQRTPDLSQDEMLALSTQIKTEQAAFGKLDYATQTKIRKEGSTEFEAYLTNETLKGQFRKLK